MKHSHLSLVICVLSLLASLAGQIVAAPAGTAFTYQGRLNEDGLPATGSYDLKFALFDAESDGTPVGADLTTEAVAVSNGLFVVKLDFGSEVFTGDARWLEMSARTNGIEADFELMTPRNELTPTPYALRAATAAVAATVSNGTVGQAQLASATAPNPGQVLAWDGMNLVWTDPPASSGNWSTTGNSGTAPGANFLGTTDNQPLEIKVNGARVFRFEPATRGDAPNLIGGAQFNTAGSMVVGLRLVAGGREAGWRMSSAPILAPSAGVAGISFMAIPIGPPSAAASTMQ